MWGEARRPPVLEMGGQGGPEAPTAQLAKAPVGLTWPRTAGETAQLEQGPRIAKRLERTFSDCYGTALLRAAFCRNEGPWV